jgi:hypothetical protein
MTDFALWLLLHLSIFDDPGSNVGRETGFLTEVFRGVLQYTQINGRMTLKIRHSLSRSHLPQFAIYSHPLIVLYITYTAGKAPLNKLKEKYES